MHALDLEGSSIPLSVSRPILQVWPKDNLKQDRPQPSRPLHRFRPSPSPFSSLRYTTKSLVYKIRFAHEFPLFDALLTSFYVQYILNNVDNESVHCPRGWRGHSCQPTLSHKMVAH